MKKIKCRECKSLLHHTDIDGMCSKCNIRNINNSWDMLSKAITAMRESESTISHLIDNDMLPKDFDCIKWKSPDMREVDRLIGKLGYIEKSTITPEGYINI